MNLFQKGRHDLPDFLLHHPNDAPGGDNHWIEERKRWMWAHTSAAGLSLGSPAEGWAKMQGRVKFPVTQPKQLKRCGRTEEVCCRSLCLWTENQLNQLSELGGTSWYQCKPPTPLFKYKNKKRERGLWKKKKSPNINSHSSAWLQLVCL